MSAHEAPFADRRYDPLGDAITVLEHVDIADPSARPDTEDAHNRVKLALAYLAEYRSDALAPITVLLSSAELPKEPQTVRSLEWVVMWRPPNGHWLEYTTRDQQSEARQVANDQKAEYPHHDYAIVRRSIEETWAP